MPKEVTFCLNDDGKPRVFKMKQITGHLDLEIQQEFTKHFPGGVAIPHWPNIWVKRLNLTTVEMKEDGVSELPMNLERVAALPAAIYNRLQAEYLASHQTLAENFLGNGEAPAEQS